MTEQGETVCDCVSVRVVVVYAKTSSEVYVVYGKPLTFKVFYDVVYSFAFEGIYLFNLNFWLVPFGMR